MFEQVHYIYIGGMYGSPVRQTKFKTPMLIWRRTVFFGLFL